MPYARLMRAGAGPRLLRAAVFTAVCVALSGVGHAVASCATVPPWALLAGFLGVFACAAPLAGRRHSLPRITAALVGGQLALHSLFGLGQHTARPAGTDGSITDLAARLLCNGSAPLSPARAREVLAAAGIDPATALAQAHAHQAAEPATGLFSLPMLLGHLLAALAAGWLLGRGDLALERLLQLSAGTRVRPLRAALALARALRAGLTGPQASAPRRPRRERSPAGTPGRESLQHTVIRRGPPAALVLAA
ncbi:hypothetical protein LG634_00050 [Streptomyces bambusae]|uniref:hypothetical protein n=1 Tax=Streptomyces bambusae TaxID=1550616 RepID=UPI001CFF198F|nr:hypothetical protein [Streptomyces bambusae]MCB5163247.1 hypothetical protein [Streptomyces bambusae]